MREIKEQHIKDIKNELIGKKFGNLVVKEYLTERHEEQIVFLCECGCGNAHKVIASNLKDGTVKSCGCLQKEIVSSNLVGKRFGRLTVLEATNERKHGQIVWKCKCDCGKLFNTFTSCLTQSNTISCGCYREETMRELGKKGLIDLTGQKFNRLTVLKMSTKRRKDMQVKWECLCECGKITHVDGQSLKDGSTQSCGCLVIELGKAGMKDRMMFIDGTCITALQNKKLSKANKTGVLGVFWDNARNKYQAKIKFKGKNYYLGRYDKLEDAAKVRKIAEENLHDSFVEWYYETYPEKKKFKNCV